MEEKNEIIIGNLTTIINSVYLATAGLILGLLSAFGLKLPVDQYGLAGVIGLVLSTIFAYINAKYHNTYFDTDEDTLTVNVNGLTSNQVNAIQKFVDNCTSINEYGFEDIDPSLAYEDDGSGDDGC